MKVWQWFSGKKTQIALWFYLIQDVILPIWYEDGVPEPVQKTCLTIAAVLGALGLGHKTVKILPKKAVG